MVYMYVCPSQSLDKTTIKLTQKVGHSGESKVAQSPC